MVSPPAIQSATRQPDNGQWAAAAREDKNESGSSVQRKTKAFAALTVIRVWSLSWDLYFV